MKNEAINMGNPGSGKPEPRAARRCEKTSRFVTTWTSEKHLLSGERLLEKDSEALCSWRIPPPTHTPMLLEDIEEDNEETPLCLKKERSREAQDYYFEDK